MYSSNRYSNCYGRTDAEVRIASSRVKWRRSSLSRNIGLCNDLHTPTASAQWKLSRPLGNPKREVSRENLHSLVNFTASPSLTSPVANMGSRVDPQILATRTQAVFEDHINGPGVRRIDNACTNSLVRDGNPAPQPKSRLCCFKDHGLATVVAWRVQLPQQPPFMDGRESVHYSLTPGPRLRVTDVPTPPLSCRSSVGSITHTPASTTRMVSGDATSLMLFDPNDEWASKLGHENFIIHPEPYKPAVCDIKSFHQLRADWEVARCNFVKHLVRTGEHYGITSKTYNLVCEKWDGINHKWCLQQDAMLNQLNSIDSVNLAPNLHSCEYVRIPHLHDSTKFPEMGDNDIVGPMTVAPTTETSAPCRTKSLKNKFFCFFQNPLSRRQRIHNN